MALTDGEMIALSRISENLKALRSFMSSRPLDEKSLNSEYWYQYVTGIKRILGNFNEDVSFIASLMAKEFLIVRHQLSNFDIALKSQSAKGLDIDEVTTDGARIIAELKATIPYYETNLGGKQKEEFFKDFKRLQTTEAKFKYFFVTELKTFEIVKRRYLGHLEGVTLVLLPQGIGKGDIDYVIQVSSSGMPRSDH